MRISEKRTSKIRNGREGKDMLATCSHGEDEIMKNQMKNK